MKILKIVVVSFILITVFVFIGLVVFVKTFDVNKYRSQIVAQISKTLGRSVEIGKISLRYSLSDGFNVALYQFEISDDPHFSQDNLFSVDEVTLNVNILKLITKHEIVVVNVLVKNPNMHFVRDNAGKVNVQALASSVSSQKVEDGEQKSVSAQDASKAAELSFFSARHIRIQNATILYEDKSTQPVLAAAVDKLDLDIENFSFDKIFNYSMACSFLSSKKNIQLKGKAQLNLKENQVRIDDLKLQTSLSDLDLAQLIKMVPAIGPVGLSSIKAEAEIVLHQMVAGSKGILVLSAGGSVTKGELRTSQLSVPVENINMNFDVTESDIILRKLTCNLSGGNVSVDARMNDFLAERRLTIHSNMDNISLGAILTKYALPVNIQGKAAGSLTAAVNVKNFSSLVETLTADGSFDVKDGKLVNVNIIKLVLGKLSFLPNLSESVEKNLSEKVKARLIKEETLIQKAEMSFKLKNAVAIVRVDVGAEDFIFSGNGDVDLRQNMNFRSFAELGKELSSSIIESVPDLKALLGEQGQIHIPFKPYQGKLADFRLYPDIGDLGQKVIKEKGKDELEKAIFKALKIKDIQQSPSSTGDPGTATEGDPSAQPEKVIIENILNNIFK